MHVHIYRVCRFTHNNDARGNPRANNFLSSSPPAAEGRERGSDGQRVFPLSPDTAEGAECCSGGQLPREHTYVDEARSAKSEYVTEDAARISGAMRLPIELGCRSTEGAAARAALCAFPSRWDMPPEQPLGRRYVPSPTPSIGAVDV